MIYCLCGMALWSRSVISVSVPSPPLALCVTPWNRLHCWKSNVLHQGYQSKTTPPKLRINAITTVKRALWTVKCCSTLICVLAVLIKVYERSTYLCLDHATTLFSHLGHYVHNVELKWDGGNWIIQTEEKHQLICRVLKWALDTSF